MSTKNIHWNAFKVFLIFLVLITLVMGPVMLWDEKGLIGVVIGFICILVIASSYYIASQE